MINAETKDYLIDLLISQPNNRFTFDYSEVDQSKLSNSECELLIEYFTEIGLIDSGSSYKQGPLKIKKHVELYDFKNAGGFERKEKIQTAEIERLFGELIKLQKSHPGLESLNNITTSIGGLISILGL